MVGSHHCYQFILQPLKISVILDWDVFTGHKTDFLTREIFVFLGVQKDLEGLSSWRLGWCNAFRSRLQKRQYGTESLLQTPSLSQSILFCSARERMACPSSSSPYVTHIVYSEFSLWVLYSVPVQNKVLLLSDILLRSSSKRKRFCGNPKNTSHLLKFRLLVESAVFILWSQKMLSAVERVKGRNWAGWKSGLCRWKA